MDKKRVIIIGASSGIGSELARVFSERGYTVGLTARRLDLLSELQKKLPGESFIQRMDVSESDEAIRILEELIKTMGGADIVVVSAGTGFLNPDLSGKKKKLPLMLMFSVLRPWQMLL